MRGPKDGAGWRVTLPALLVAVGAVAATAHGLFEVALSSGVPWPIAAIYPLITDGLALVAYSATHRLRGISAGYAWVVTVLAAGLSGLAQATYLASGATLDASPELRFGVGAWPAVAAAIVAHLLYLLSARHPGRATLTTPGPATLPTGATTPLPAAPSVGLVDGPPPCRPQLVAELVAQHHPATTPPAPPPTKPSPTVRTAPTTTPKTESLPAVVFDANAPQEERLAAIFDAGRGRGTVSEAFGLDPNPARKVWSEYRARRRQEASA